MHSRRSRPFQAESKNQINKFYAPSWSIEDEGFEYNYICIYRFMFGGCDSPISLPLRPRKIKVCN